jgi:hypothetical protein
MKVLLQRGDTLVIQLADSHGNIDDGSFTIEYGQACVEIQAEYSDSRGREGIIYANHYGSIDLDDRQEIQQILDPLYMNGELEPEALREAYRDLPDGWPLVHDLNDPTATRNEDRFMRIIGEIVVDCDNYDYAWLKPLEELVANKVKESEDVPF